MRDLYIFGAGGFGRETAWVVERINEVEPTWNLRGFVDDDEALWGAELDGYPVCGGMKWLSEQEETWCVCAIGSARIRKSVVKKLQAFQNLRFATLIDPSVIMSRRVEIGEGAIICAGTIMTVDVRIGSHVIINMDCTIGHDAVLEDCVTLYPSVNVSGLAYIGECAELGTGMQIIQGKRIGTGSILGAGAVVVKDIPQNCVAVGCPARVTKRLEVKEGQTAVGG